MLSLWQVCLPHWHISTCKKEEMITSHLALEILLTEHDTKVKMILEMSRTIAQTTMELQQATTLKVRYALSISTSTLNLRPYDTNAYLNVIHHHSFETRVVTGLSLSPEALSLNHPCLYFLDSLEVKKQSMNK
jgi:hypothetical protein